MPSQDNPFFERTQGGQGLYRCRKARRSFTQWCVNLIPSTNGRLSLRQPLALLIRLFQYYFYTEAFDQKGGNRVDIYERIATMSLSFDRGRGGGKKTALEKKPKPKAQIPTAARSIVLGSFVLVAADYVHEILAVDDSSLLASKRSAVVGSPDADDRVGWCCRAIV
jgi:hypothetical protein